MDVDDLDLGFQQRARAHICFLACDPDSRRRLGARYRDRTRQCSPVGRSGGAEDRLRCAPKIGCRDSREFIRPGGDRLRPSAIPAWAARTSPSADFARLRCCFAVGECSIRFHWRTSPTSGWEQPRSVAFVRLLVDRYRWRLHRAANRRYGRGSAILHRGCRVHDLAFYGPPCDIETRAKRSVHLLTHRDWYLASPP